MMLHGVIKKTNALYFNADKMREFLFSVREIKFCFFRSKVRLILAIKAYCYTIHYSVSCINSFSQKMGSKNSSIGSKASSDEKPFHRQGCKEKIDLTIQPQGPQRPNNQPPQPTTPTPPPPHSQYSRVFFFFLY